MKTFQSFLVISFLLLASTMISAQSSQDRSVETFSELSVQSGIDLFLTQDDDQSVRIIAKDDIIDDIITEVRGGHLKIFLDKPNWKRGWNDNKIEAHVSVDYLRKLMASGGSDVVSSGVWKSDDFELMTSGGSDVEMEINVEELVVQCSGGSDIDISGNAGKIILTSSGGSDFNGHKLSTKDARITSSGGSDVYIQVSDKLIARASGSSDIHYSGNPSIRDIDTSSSADVRKF